MPRQQLLQGFHNGTIEINSTVSILSKDGMTTYFVGGDNYSFHSDGDEQSRCCALAQLMLNGHARPVEIERSALGIPHRTLMNWQRKFQDGGAAAAFFRAPARGRGPVLTPQKTLECQRLLVEAEYRDLLQQRRKTPRKIMLADLAEDQRPSALKTPGKKLVDIVKMIAYRAETALVGQVLPHLGKEADARALIRELLVSSADIEPDSEAGTLTVRVHRMTTAAHDVAVAGLLAKLTAEEFAHPQTGLRMIYELV